MIWAIKEGEKIMPSPKDTAECPICNEKVIAKCGKIKFWHWSHISLKDCDTWSEGETEWHKSWKDNFPKEQQEVVVGKHRVDIKLPSGMVLELQNSPISTDEIKEREEYYGKMIWLLNGKKLWTGLEIKQQGTEIVTFRWKHPAKSWWNTTKPIYLDLSELAIFYENKIQEVFNKIMALSDSQLRYLKEGYERQYSYYDNLVDLCKNKILLIKKVYPNLPCGGYGKLISKEEFLKQLK